MHTGYLDWNDYVENEKHITSSGCLCNAISQTRNNTKREILQPPPKKPKSTAHTHRGPSKLAEEEKGAILWDAIAKK